MRRLIFRALAMLCGLLWLTAAAAQPGPQCTQGESVTAFGEWFAPNVTLDGQTRKANKLVPPLTTLAVGVRLQIDVNAPTGQSWSLVLRDEKLRILAILTEQDFAAGKTVQWTGRLDSPQISGELIGGGPGVQVKFQSGMALPQQSAGVAIFSTQVAGVSNWADPYELTVQRYQKAAEAVGMMVTGAQAVDALGVPRKQTWCCSGAMLTPSIYITNWHCGGKSGVPEAAYWNEQVCANTVLDLSWHDGTTARRQYMCEAVLHQSKRLDYALLRVRAIVGPGAATGRAVPVQISRTLPATDEVFVVHHAQCKPKLVSFSGCRIVSRSHRAWTDDASAATGPDITHSCDTEPGASGAPVFDSNGKMIALHHLGFQTGGPQCPIDRVNKATTLSSILDDVAAARPQLYAELTAP